MLITTRFKRKSKEINQLLFQNTYKFLILLLTKRFWTWAQYNPRKPTSMISTYCHFMLQHRVWPVFVCCSYQVFNFSTSEWSSSMSELLLQWWGEDLKRDFNAQMSVCFICVESMKCPLSISVCSSLISWGS